jgi:ribA/ribD-fused uncharacterized protein
MVERKVPPYAVHNDVAVKGFFGRYFFLSNFYPCVVQFEGMAFPSSENAYQSAKVEHNYQHFFTGISANESKKAWKEYPKLYTASQWENIKYDIMAAIIFEKFYQNTELRQALLETGERQLEELNHWNDSYWGVSCHTNGGRNKLGKLLMKTREFWR